MHQDFRRRTTPGQSIPRLADLRGWLAGTGCGAFLVPRADAHQGETVAACDERLAWLTGFTGSAGIAAIAAERAAIFVDGRYRLQVRDEVDTSAFELLRHPEDKLSDWLAEAVPAGTRIAYDPWLHTIEEIETLAAALAPHDISLDAVAANPLDEIWTDRPAPPAPPIILHPVTLSGRPPAEKRAEIARTLAARNLAATVLTLPDSIAWLLDIRGSDIPRTPVLRAFAILHGDGRVALFTEPGRATPALMAHLGSDVTLHAPDAFETALVALAPGPVLVDPARSPSAIAALLDAAGVAMERGADPCILPKALKTEAEIAGTRAAHLRDGAAMVRFLAWFDREAPAGTLTEIAVVTRLEEIREETGALHDISFETIAGSGPNGAIVHYRVNETTDRHLAPGELLLLDSGAQYRDGTTDITRTLAVGPVDPATRLPFTLVLKGLIAMSRLRWPHGLAGRDLDAVARTALWAHGLDYDHGTGHGIGAFLGVHEGPQGLSRRALAPLEAGMILSIEPAFYREGAYGIRSENLAVVTPAEIPAGGERPMLGFETLTLAPFDRRLIAPELLDPAEAAWLDAYHARVLMEIGPLVSPAEAHWLRSACAPLDAASPQ